MKMYKKVLEVLNGMSEAKIEKILKSCTSNLTCPMDLGMTTECLQDDKIFSCNDCMVADYKPEPVLLPWVEAIKTGKRIRPAIDGRKLISSSRMFQGVLWWLQVMGNGYCDVGLSKAIEWMTEVMWEVEAE